VCGGVGRPDGRIELLRAGRCRRDFTLWSGPGATLATVVGVLVEVPVMLSVVAIVKRTRNWNEQPVT
jgi:hypothetical protein